MALTTASKNETSRSTDIRRQASRMKRNPAVYLQVQKPLGHLKVLYEESQETSGQPRSRYAGKAWNL